jgi:UDPglucose 6-dehydrogenase
VDISVFGQGKVGLVLAACLATAGHRVTGVDVSSQLVERINARSISSTEPGLEDMLRELGPEQLCATLDGEDAVTRSDVTFIIVPTPSNSFGGFSLRYVLKSCETIGSAIRNKTGVHTVAVVSTMLPGSSMDLVIPALEKASGKCLGDGFDYCYNPAFIALGDVVRGFQRPDFLLVGQASERAGDTMLEVHQPVMANGAPVARMSPTEGEICKLASNTHETMRVSFANMLLAVCAQIPGANVDRITNALTHRMGKRFFKGAVPYGGPCWPRDNEALAVVMDALGVPTNMPRAVDTFNAEHGRFILRKVLELSDPEQVLGVIGLAYKPGTEVVERSFGVSLVASLAAEGRNVIGWDPLAASSAQSVLGERVEIVDSFDTIVRRADVLVLVNPLPVLESLAENVLSEKCVIDCWRSVPEHIATKLASYVPLGIGDSRNGGASIPRALGERLTILAN